MENRKPFKLKYILIVYNAIQVVFSTWLFLEACTAGWTNGYSWRCQQVDYSNSPHAIRVRKQICLIIIWKLFKQLLLQTAEGCWWYYFSKFTEFFDTFFFIMRKRYDQVSTLHVIHHGIMPFSVWWGVKFAPGGHSSFFGFLNTFVHIFMYAYYMLAAMGPAVQKYLWWKKYLTILQMVNLELKICSGFFLINFNFRFNLSVSWYIPSNWSSGMSATIQWHLCTLLGLMHLCSTSCSQTSINEHTMTR